MTVQKHYWDYADTSGADAADGTGAPQVSVPDATWLTSLRGSAVTSSLLGASGNLEALPTSGTGPDAYEVDLSAFSGADIYFVLVTSAAVENWSATITYYNQDSTETHSTDASFSAAATGSRAVVIPRKDKMATITISNAVGTESCWAYVFGVENA